MPTRDSLVGPRPKTRARSKVGLSVADFELLVKTSEVEARAQELLQEETIAVDTEADSFYHYFDKTCLIQIGTPRQIYLIDPLAETGHEILAPLGPVFESPEVQKIFHAGEYDLFVLKRDCRFNFDNLFDTMISAQLLGYNAVGLAALAEKHFGLKLPKDEQRSDWSVRPLRKNQLTYAAADVAYLIPLAERLKKELDTSKRLDWAQEEFSALTRREWPERTFDRLGYLKIKGARKLDISSLAVLRELYLIRDKRARDIDRPAFKVLGNGALLEIAQVRPTTVSLLGKIKGVTELILRRLGPEILRAIDRGKKRGHGPIPKIESATPRRRMDRKGERRVARLKKWRTARAKELNLDLGVLCPNSGLEAIAAANPQETTDLLELSELKSWFRNEFGQEVVIVLQEEETS